MRGPKPWPNEFRVPFAKEIQQLINDAGLALGSLDSHLAQVSFKTYT